MGQRTKGKCKYCGKEYTFSYMSRHLLVCEERQKKLANETGGKECRYFELAICARYDRNYWLFVEMQETAALEDLDCFLRDIWVECCGHLSAFEMDGISYSVAPQEDFFWGRMEKSMNCKLGSVLEKGMTFGYEYDFGSTTELVITVAGDRKGIAGKEKLIILSRNNPIEFMCEECGKKSAAYICTECLYEGKGYLCEDCAKTHECGEEMLLNICNSPRMGVCGYCGSDIYPDQFVPDV
ncbi:MAG: plasmid pRiA4b ORF-3 family protein [Clostridium sp.]|nr:plasmid pRiA4b ORF-3 family protein [Clostridium sp.]